MITENELLTALSNAIDRLRKRDDDLLRLDVHEVTVTTRIGYYLSLLIEREDSPLRVDCEYNRDRAATKELDEELLRPDVIVHERDTDRNYLIAECKKSGRGPKVVRDDLNRLLRMLEPPYSYKSAAYIEVGPARCVLWWGATELREALQSLPPA